VVGGANLYPPAPSDGVGGAEDGVVDPNVVGQVGHVVAFALAVGVVLHAVQRQVVQAHLIVAIAQEHLGDGSGHELRDGGGCRQLWGGCGGQQGERAGGEGVEVFAVDHGVDAAAQFHHVFVGFQNQEGPVERHGDAHGGVEGVARVAEGEHVAVADFVDLDEFLHREHLARGFPQDLALGVGVGGLQQAVEGRGGFVAGAHEADHLELARAPFAVFEDLQPVDAEGEELGGGRGRRLGLGMAGGLGGRLGSAGGFFGGFFGEHQSPHRMAGAQGLARGVGTLRAFGFAEWRCWVWDWFAE